MNGGIRMEREQLELMKTLQALEFTAFDLALYLNTHPNNQRALADYSKAVRETEHVRNVYVRTYGPLMAEDNVNQPSWRWAENPGHGISIINRRGNKCGTMKKSCNTPRKSEN